MRRFRIKIDDEIFEVEVEEIGHTGELAAPVAGATAPSPRVQPVPAAKPAAAPVTKPSAKPGAGAGSVTAPIPGTITEVKTAKGNSVKKGEVLLILEAMKMQNEILAPYDATVVEVCVSQGESVQTGDVLVNLDK